MMIEVLKSKLHCVTVTEANLNYMGSITIDEDLTITTVNVLKPISLRVNVAQVVFV